MLRYEVTVKLTASASEGGPEVDCQATGTTELPRHQAEYEEHEELVKTLAAELCNVVDERAFRKRRELENSGVLS